MKTAPVLLLWLVTMATPRALCSEARSPALRPEGTMTSRTQTGVNPAVRRVLAARPLKIGYYVSDSRGLASLKAHAREMTLLAPQSYWIDTEGGVYGEIPQAVSDIAREHQLPLMPLIVNPRFDRDIISTVLRDPKVADQVITYLVYLTKRDNLIGFQLDFENIPPADKDLFTKFVSRAAVRFHQVGKLLGVAVVPRFSDGDKGRSPSGDFATGEWGAPYDYHALGRVVDFVVLMAYDQHGPATLPGPVAGYEWVTEALGYALPRIPRDRLILGIPLFGREWTNNRQVNGNRGLSYQEITQLLAKPKVARQWDDRWRSPWFRYEEGSSTRTVWYEDDKSLRAKLALVAGNRLRGFAAWRLGFEDPAFWVEVRAIERHSRVKPTSTAPAKGKGKK